MRFKGICLFCFIIFHLLISTTGLMHHINFGKITSHGHLLSNNGTPTNGDEQSFVTEIQNATTTKMDPDQSEHISTTIPDATTIPTSTTNPLEPVSNSSIS